MPSARVLSVARLRSSVTCTVNTRNTDSGAIMAYMTRGLVAVTAALALSVTGGAVAAPAHADPRETAKTSTATGPRVIYAMIAPESVLRVLTVLVTLLRRRATLNTRADGIGCSSGSCQKWAVVWLQDRSHQKLSVAPEMI